jgi:hypothetical protein
MNRPGKTVIVGIAGLILMETGAILLWRSNAQASMWALDSPVGISQRVPSHSEQFGWLAFIIWSCVCRGSIRQVHLAQNKEVISVGIGSECDRVQSVDAVFDLMKNLTDSRWIKLKGILFLVVGLLSSALILAEHPDLKTGVLLCVSVWCFCRFYYFAFYVIEHYVDPGYRFSGLWSFLRYLLSRRDPPSS